MCLDLDGRARWCTYLNSCCCGGTAYPLPNGHYVASSGCSGTLSWLDPDGRVLFRSAQRANAFLTDVKVLADSACIVSGEGWIAAYEHDGRLRWIRNDGFLDFDYHEERDLLIEPSWAPKTGTQTNVQIQCVKGLGGE